MEKILKTRKQVRSVLLIFALLGLALSLFLAYEYAQPTAITCGISIGASNSCETVRQSEYAKLIGIDLPIWGSLFFVTVNISLIFSLIKKETPKFFDKGLFALLTFGIIFETIYTFIQIFVIKAICSWCILTETTVFCLFFINLIEMIMFRKKKRDLLLTNS